MSENSLINLGNLSEPATVLINRVSDAIGGIFKPHQIVRVAKAEKEAQIIAAEANIQVSDLQKRAMHRFLEEEAKKQQNIENITEQALPLLTEDSSPGDLDEDWIVNFFDKCRIVSDDQMQQLWSNILAGESNSPGTFSKRTVNALSSLDKEDATLFTNLCTFKWGMPLCCPMIYNCDDEIYTKRGIKFESLSHLDSIGLVNFSPARGFSRFKLPKNITLHYFEVAISIEFNEKSDNVIDVGEIMLTQIGNELSQICGATQDLKYLDHVKAVWQEKGYKIIQETT